MNYGTLDFTELEEKHTQIEFFVKQICIGKLRSMLVSVPPGVGKTHSTKDYLSKYCTGKFKIVAGHMSMLSLYGELYRHRKPGNVLMLDDIDSVYSTIEGLNILKAAMDTLASTSISWESSTHYLTSMGVPKHFDFEGGVILVTNEGRGKFNKKLMAHFEALCDRTFPVRLGEDTAESKLEQINFMVLKKNLLGSFNFSQPTIIEILDYINENYESLSNLSLRTAFKAAQLVSIDPTTWKQMAKVGLKNA
jgi:hypothetical protein